MILCCASTILFSLVGSLLQCCVHAFDKLLCIMLQCNIIIINMLFFHYCRYLLWFCNNVFVHALAGSLYWPYFILKLYCNNCPYVGYLIEHDSGDCLAVMVNAVRSLYILLFHSYIYACPNYLRGHTISMWKTRRNIGWMLNIFLFIIFPLLLFNLLANYLVEHVLATRPRPALNNCKQSPSG